MIGRRMASEHAFWLHGRVVDAGLADVDGDALLGGLPAQRPDQLLFALRLARRAGRRLLPLARGLL